MLKHLTYLLTFVLVNGFAQQAKEYVFIENKGQWDKHVAFKTEVANGAIYFEKGLLTYDFFEAEEFERYVHAHHEKETKKPFDKLKCHSYKVKFLGASNEPIISSQKVRAYTNYFIGDNPATWASNVAGYKNLTYKNVYPKVDLVYYTAKGNLKYDFRLKPGANPDNIQLQYEGVNEIKISKENLRIQTSVNQIVEEKPYAYQLVNGIQKEVACEYRLNGNTISFYFPNGYDASKELIIDPVLQFSTYSGSFSNNFGYTATFDRYGFLYSGSTAFGNAYPTTVGAYDVSFNGGIVDVAISKYDTSGTFMVYSTYVGGNNDELPHSMIVNSNNELFVYGTTSSLNFPTTAGAYDNSFNGGTPQNLQNGLGVNFTNGSDIYVFRLSTDGDNLLASTLIGGSGNDGLNVTPTVDIRYNYADEVRGEIEIDKNNNIYIVSCTRSTDFPTTPGVFQPTYGGGQIDGCVFKMDNQLTTLQWSSYIGGSANDAAYSLALSSNDNPYITGGTVSANFPTTPGTLYPTYQGGRSDAFIALIDKSGSSILTSSYFGSSAYDQAYFIELDKEDDVHVFGQTEHTGSTFIINAAYANPNSGQFISKIKPTLDTVIWSTVFGSGGGAPNISPTAFLVDVCNKIYLSGWGGNTNSFATQNNAISTNGMPITIDAFQSNTDGSDFYLMVLEADASALVYGSYFGGNLSDEHVDGGTSRFDRNGRMYQSVCAGCGGNSDFPIQPNPGAVSAVNNNSCNNGVFKFDFNLPITVADFDATPVVCMPDTTFFTNLSLRGTTFSWDFGDGNTSSLRDPFHVYTASGTYTVTLAISDSTTCNLGDTITKEVTVLASSTWSLASDTICTGDFIQIGTTPNVSPGITYAWTPGASLSDSTIANPIASPSQTTNYRLVITNGACMDTIYQTVEVTNLVLNTSNDTIICSPNVPVSLQASSGGTSSAYYWSNTISFADTLNPLGDSNIVVSANGTSTYFVKIERNGCFLTDSVHVTVFNDEVTLNGPLGICLGDTISLTANTTMSGGVTYTWEPTIEILSGDGTSSITTAPNGTTWYSVSVTDTNGCEARDSIRIYVSPLTSFLIGATTDNDTIVVGGSTTIHAQPDGFSYSWSPSSSLSSTTSQHPLASPIESTTYSVTISDTGCVQLRQVTVYVRDVICGAPDVYVPNAFSPDKDGFNDVLFVRGNNITQLQFSVFDRWGEKVFETQDQNIGWNGTYKGRASDPAVFVYYLEVTCGNQETYFEKGNVTLVR